MPQNCKKLFKFEIEVEFDESLGFFAATDETSSDKSYSRDEKRAVGFHLQKLAEQWTKRD